MKKSFIIDSSPAQVETLTNPFIVDAKISLNKLHIKPFVPKHTPYIPERLTDIDKISEIMLNIEGGNGKRFSNNTKFKNVLKELKENPDTITHLNTLLNARDKKISIQEIGLFLHSAAKSQNYDKYLAPMLETNVSYSDIRCLLNNLTEEKKPYVDKILQIRNKRWASTNILNSVNKENEKHLGTVLEVGNKGLREKHISECLELVNDSNIERFKKLSDNGNVEKDEIPFLLKNMTDTNEKHFDRLAKAKENDEIHSYDILPILDDYNEKYLNQLIANPELNSIDIAEILAQISKDKTLDINEIVHKKIISNIENDRSRHYSNKTQTIMSHMRKVAKDLNLPDFYTGKRFDNKKNSDVNIEHLILYDDRIEEFNSGFNVNSLFNFVPIRIKVNSERGHTPIKEWYRKNPQYLKNSRNALIEYEKVDTPIINGKEWVKGLKETLNSHLGFRAFE